MNQIEEDEDDIDDDDDYIDYDMLTTDQWEDQPAYQKIKKEMPKGWVIVKVVNFGFRSLDQMKTWLKDNCKSKYKQVGFHSGCSYNVGVQFEDSVDAIMFKLRWS